MKKFETKEELEDILNRALEIHETLPEDIPFHKLYEQLVKADSVEEVLALTTAYHNGLKYGRELMRQQKEMNNLDKEWL